MSLPETLDIAIGLAFVYLLMSIIATAAREAMSGFLKTRARLLEKGLFELIGNGDTGRQGKALVGAFYDHPLIKSLYRGHYAPPRPFLDFLRARRLPSYIPSGHFSIVLFELIAARAGYKPSDPYDGNDLTAAASATLGDTGIGQIVQVALRSTGGDLAAAREFMEASFDSSMERVSGWYRQNTQSFLFWFSLIACVVLNVNSVVIAENLFQSPSLRKVVDAQAVAFVDSHKAAGVSAPANPESAKTDLKLARDALDQLSLPLGWGPDTMKTLSAYVYGRDVVPDATRPSLTTGINHLLGVAHVPITLPPLTLAQLPAIAALAAGWLMTALAATLGAPFWFDLLSRLIQIRSTLKPKSGNGDITPDTDTAKAKALPNTRSANTQGHASDQAAQPVTPRIAAPEKDIDIGLDPRERLAQDDGAPA